MTRVTIPLGSQDDDIHALAFRFVGAFAHNQVFIDDMLTKRFLEVRVPETSKFLLESSMRRLRDSERPRLVTLIAADTDSDADLSCFTDVYKRVKKMRDKCAHSVRVTSISNDELELTQSVLTSGPDPSVDSESVTRSELIDALKSCAWIEAQLMYILDSSDLIEKMYLGGQRVGVAKPTRLPKDWDGIVLTPRSDS